VEPAIALEGDAGQCFQVTPHSTQDDCERVRAQAESAGGRLVSLASGLGWMFPMTSRDADVRAQGIETTRRSLQVAAWSGVDALLVVPGGVGVGEDVPTRYDAAYDNALASPRAGCYFDVGNVLVSGYPEQWIEILAGRVSRVHFKDWKRSVGNIDGFCPLLEGDVDFPAVMSALRTVGYNGAVTSEFFNCEEDLPTISRAMDTILAS
jgi:L-ribulose-5-phosphate 3-epimerase